MKRRTKIKIVYAVVFFIIGLIIGQLLPSYITLNTFEPKDVVPAVGKEERGELSNESIKEADSEDGDHVKIGVVLPLTGDLAVLGQPVRESIELALRDAGVDNVDLIFEDSKCLPTETVTAVQKLVNVDHVSALIGDLCSSPTLAVVPIINESKIPMISPSSTSPLLSGSSKYFFRTISSDKLQGEAMAGQAIHLGYDEVAIIAINNEYGVGLEKSFTDAFEKGSGKIVRHESFEQGASDFRTQLTKIKDEDPDALYIISYPSEGGQLLRQARELGVDIPLLASEGIRDNSVLDVAGKAAEGIVITVPFENRDAKYEHFQENFKALAGADPGLFTAEAYDATQLVLFALKRSDGSSEGIRNGLASIKEYHGASGIITFDENGDVSKPYEFYTVKDGTFIPFEG